jgi:hypothetical protein
MDKALTSAQQIAELVRFSGDTLRNKSAGESAPTEAVAGTLFQNELEISAEVTPGLWAQLESAREHLSIPPDTIHAFVYASPELQASCFATSTQNCVLRFSSGLIDLLDAREFAFVCGHELGHFLLGHGISKMESGDLSIEYFMQQRAQEISVDRIGLIAAGSLDVAIRALMKTVSGLSNEHLRFDVGRFLSQLGKSGAMRGASEFEATHPSILVRCRALLWFSLNDYFTVGHEAFSRAQFDALDARIQKDLATYVDGPAREKIEQAKNDLALWIAANEIVQNGVFGKADQIAFEKMFGAEMLAKLINFLRDIPRSEVQDAVYERVRTTREALEALIPSSFECEVAEIQHRISANLK